MRFNLKDYEKVKKSDVKDEPWKTAKYRKSKYGNKDNKTLQYLRKGMVILLASFHLKMGGKIAYDEGYNSDFAQFFWDEDE